MPKSLRLVLSHHLSHSLPTLKETKQGDVVIFLELKEEAIAVAHHPKKIAFLFSAMRHFANECQQEGMFVDYIKFTDPHNTQTLISEVTRALQRHQCEKVIVTEPADWITLTRLQTLQLSLEKPLIILEDSRFLCSREDFNKWSHGKKHYRMEFFYREMRKKYNILLTSEGGPIGDKWNYDHDNRNPPKSGLTSPKRISHPKDSITDEVLSLVKENFSHHFGDLLPFHFAVTRAQAKLEAEHFMKDLLPCFGYYQDTMVKGEAYLYHSLLSAYLNAGLLEPLELCQWAEIEYRKGHAPLNAVEGFIRQILGWREYVRGIYWKHMPEYQDLNYFRAQRPLPAFYWGKPTQMACVAEAVNHTKIHAYSHHIQRLMVTGNFALLAGLDPKAVHQWYLEVYADAFEWVEMPNTLGMALFADGGVMGSKPYAASGKYIDRMSNFCKSCPYDPKETTTPNACPFNALYWDFMGRNEELLRNNQRLTYIYGTWDKFGTEKQKTLQNKAREILEAMAAETL